MNRDLLKKAIRKLVIQEITNNQLGTPDHRIDSEAEKALSKVEDKATTIPGTGKTVATGKKHHIELSKNADDCYDVLSVTNESDRRVAKQVSLDDAIEFVKKHAKESEKSYVEKAGDKSLKGFGKTPPKTEEKDEVDTMDDVDEETQVDTADKTDFKAEEKADKKLAPVNKDNSAQQGGTLVDKIEKIIDRVLKDKSKADAKTAHLKTDTKMESPDKLVVKDKGTPALKGNKK